MPMLNKFPRGFMSLVGLFSEGQNPRLLADQVVPTVEIGSNYLLESVELVFGAQVAAVAGFNSVAPALVVPPGEVWKLLWMTTSVVSGAGQTGSYGVAVRLGPTGAQRMQLSGVGGYAANQTVWVSLGAGADGLLLSSGWELGFELQQQVGGSATHTVQALIGRLRA